jgi:hypothetical protein
MLSYSRDMANASIETVDMKLERYIQRAENLRERCEKLKDVKGAGKLTRKVCAEVKFLEGLKHKSGKNKENSLSSSNLVNLQGVVDAVETFPDVCQVLQPFQCPGYEHPLVVDVVCNHGYTWVKVIARKAQALHLIWAGEGQYGEKSIDKQAEQFIQCARLYPVNFTVPQIVFAFCQGVTKEMRQHLVKMGVDVKGEIEELDAQTQKKLEDLQSLDTDSDSDLSNCDPDTAANKNKDSATLHIADSQGQESVNSVNFIAHPDINKVNLDVTTMIVLVSNVCHGHCNYKFQEDILNQQAANEREKPVLPSIYAFLEGKKLYACSTALASFQKIVDVVGGPTEKQRAQELISTITSVPDDISQRTKNLQTSAQLKHRAKQVFGSGDLMQAVTTTSNMGFVRAAQNQGCDFAVFLHESRALTEQKQATATPL